MKPLRVTGGLARRAAQIMAVPWHLPLCASLPGGRPRSRAQAAICLDGGAFGSVCQAVNVKVAKREKREPLGQPLLSAPSPSLSRRALASLRAARSAAQRPQKPSPSAQPRIALGRRQPGIVFLVVLARLVQELVDAPLLERRLPPVHVSSRLGAGGGRRIGGGGPTPKHFWYSWKRPAHSLLSLSAPRRYSGRGR